MSDFWIGILIMYGISIIVGVVCLLIDLHKEKPTGEDWVKYLKLVH